MRPLPIDVLARRGTSFAGLGVADADGLRALVGTTVTEPGFSSTAVGGQGQFGGDLLLHLQVPAGTAAVWAEPLSGHTGQNELLLAPGAQLRILHVATENGSRPVVTARIDGPQLPATTEVGEADRLLAEIQAKATPAAPAPVGAGITDGALTGEAAYAAVPDVLDIPGMNITGRYIGQGYKQVNAELRAGQLSEHTREVADQLDGLIARSVIDTPIVVHRGLPDGGFLGHNLAGQTLTEPAFLSTTTDEAVAHRFIDKNLTGALVSLRLPAGQSRPRSSPPPPPRPSPSACHPPPTSRRTGTPTTRRRARP
jgi:hypothetical protein